MVDYKIDKFGPQLARERETYYSQLYEKVQKKHEQPSKFEEYLLSKLNDENTNQSTVRMLSRRGSGHNEYPLGLDSHTYSLKGISNQGQFDSRISKIRNRSMSTQILSGSGSYTNRRSINPFESEMNKSSRKNFKISTPLQTPGSSRLNSPTKKPTDSEQNGNGERLQNTKSSKANLIKTSNVYSKSAAKFFSRRNNSAHQIKTNNPKMSDSFEAQPKPSSQELLKEDAEIEKVVKFNERGLIFSSAYDFF